MSIDASCFCSMSVESDGTTLHMSRRHWDLLDWRACLRILLHGHSDRVCGCCITHCPKRMTPSNLTPSDFVRAANDTLSFDATEDASDSGSGRGLCGVILVHLALLHGGRNNVHMVLVAVLGGVHTQQPLSGVCKYVFNT